MTTQDFIIRFVAIRNLAGLTEIVPAAVAAIENIAPPQTHDALNDLIMDGRIELSESGLYHPCKVEATQVIL